MSLNAMLPKAVKALERALDAASLEGREYDANWSVASSGDGTERTVVLVVGIREPGPEVAPNGGSAEVVARGKTEVRFRDVDLLGGETFHGRVLEHW